jgi:hypothetical protein
MGDVATFMFVIMIISSVIFGLEFVLLFCSCMCSKSNRGGTGRICFGIIHGVITLVLFATNIGLYASLRS